MHWNQVPLQIFQLFQFTHTLLHFVSSIQFVAVQLRSISDMYVKSLHSFTLQTRGFFEVLSLHSPSIAVDRCQQQTIQR